jgi:hypothetical protein
VVEEFEGGEFFGEEELGLFGEGEVVEAGHRVVEILARGANVAGRRSPWLVCGNACAFVAVW